MNYTSFYGKPFGDVLDALYEKAKEENKKIFYVGDEIELAIDADIFIMETHVRAPMPIEPYDEWKDEFLSIFENEGGLFVFDLNAFLQLPVARIGSYTRAITCGGLVQEEHEVYRFVLYMEYQPREEEEEKNE